MWHSELDAAANPQLSASCILLCFAVMLDTATHVSSNLSATFRLMHPPPVLATTAVR